MAGVEVVAFLRSMGYGMSVCLLSFDEVNFGSFQLRSFHMEAILRC